MLIVDRDEQPNFRDITFLEDDGDGSGVRFKGEDDA